MIQDIHAHTYYSNCGRDLPQVIIEKAIEGGIEVFGITDHNYGIGDRKRQYYEEITGLRDLYRDKIKILCGIELATIEGLQLKDDEDVSYFDYCLVEHIDSDRSVLKGELIAYSKRLGCKMGIAHTDLFRYARTIDRDPLDFFKELADHNIFWEMNVNYDTIHGYREHAYYLEFLINEQMQDIVRESGLELAVGFDGHKVEDYRPDRVIEMNKFIKDKGLKLVKIPYVD